MNVEIVNPADWIPQIRDLLEANWAETGFGFPFDPDVAAYDRLYAVGAVFGVLARSGDKVIGYCSVVVTRHPHNRNVVVAANDALFVDPAWRKGMATYRIMRAAEAEAKERGAVRFSWHCRYGTPLAETLVKHGYTPVDNVVMKEI